jgi:hypothetical protein
MKKNPFVYGGPVKPDLFVDRHQEAVTVLNRLANPNDRGSSAISGSHRIGKTSFLHYIMHIAKVAPWELSLDKAHFVFLGCSSIPLDDGGLLNETEFWSRVLRSLERELPDRLKTCAKEILGSSDVTDSLGLELFFEDIAKSGRLVALLLDEFEYLVEQSDPVNPRLLYTLKSLINQPAPRGLALVTASKEALSTLGSKLRWRGSPFYNNFAFITLKPFNEDEVNELINLYLKGTGVEFSLQDRQFIYRVSEGHPEQVQYACSLLFEKKAESSVGGNT